jgi:hypothetical protein
MVSKTELEGLRQAYPDLPWAGRCDPAAQQGVAERPPQRPDGPVFETRPALAVAPR